MKASESLEIQKMLVLYRLMLLSYIIRVSYRNKVIDGSNNEGMLWGGNVSIGVFTSRFLQKSWNQELKASEFRNFEA